MSHSVGSVSLSAHRNASRSTSIEENKYFKCLIQNNKFTLTQYRALSDEQKANFTVNICKLFGRDESTTFEQVRDLTPQQRGNFTDHIVYLHQSIRSPTIAVDFVAITSHHSAIFLGNVHPAPTHEEKSNHSTLTFTSIANLTLGQRNRLSDSTVITNICEGKITVQQALQPSNYFCNIL